jgi:hypothetical protein
MRVLDSALEPFDSKSTGHSALEFAMFIGNNSNSNSKSYYYKPNWHRSQCCGQKGSARV